MKLDRGTFDTLPLSLITTRTVESLAALLGTDLNVLRFRPNLVIEAIGAAAFPEDEWVGRDLTVGTTWMRIDKRDKRCVVVNVDPVTGRRDPTVLRAIAAHRDTCLGVYGSTIRPGRVAVGDSVVLRPHDTDEYERVSGSVWAREKGDQMSAPNDQISEAPSGLAAPARRALAEAGFERWSELAAVSEAEIAGLHGFGKNALVQVREALEERGLAFAED